MKAGRKDIVFTCLYCTKSAAIQVCICKNPKCAQLFAGLADDEQEYYTNTYNTMRVINKDYKRQLRAFMQSQILKVKNENHHRLAVDALCDGISNLSIFD
jgi:hypothetical protein